MLGNGQRGQVNVQPQPISRKVMGQGAALSPEQGFTALPKLAQAHFIEDIQGAHQAGLFRKADTVPGLSQDPVGTSAGIDLSH